MRRSQLEIDSLAAIILAGGSGTRLSSLARNITGRDTRVYSGVDDYGFSDSVLSEFPKNLGVLSVSGLVWNDLGEPSRVLATIDQLGYRPKWLQA